MGRALECDGARLALWPFYEGSGAAAREVCGWGSPATWAASAGVDPSPQFCMTCGCKRTYRIPVKVF